MKKLLLLFLLTTPMAWATTTTTNVTAHVVDANATVYQNCSYNVSWVAGTGSAIPTIGGVQGFQQIYDGAKCDGSGNLAITLYDNNQISPTGSQWRFSICDQTKAYCFATTLTITGASQNISTSLTSAAALLPQVAGGFVDATSAQTITGAKTFKVINNIRTVDGINFTSIQAAITNLSGFSTRGGWVFDMRFGSIVEPTFTAPPGVHVVMACANYGMTGQILASPNASVEGCGSGNSGGTIVHYDGGLLNQPTLIASTGVSSVNYWESARIAHLRLDMGQGGSLAAGAYPMNISYVGQNSSIEDVYETSASGDGYYFDHNAVPLRLVGLSAFSNGGCGYKVDFGNDGDSSGNAVLFDSSTGDNNGTALYCLQNASDRATTTVIGGKSERSTNSTKNNPVFLLTGYNGSLYVPNFHAYTLTALAGTPTGDIVKIVTSGTPDIYISGTQRLYSNVINDTVASRTMAVQGNYIPEVHYVNGMADFREHGGSWWRFYTSGSQDAIQLREFGDAEARTVLRGNGRLSLGDGTTPADAILYRDSPNTLKTDGAFVAVGGVSTGTSGSANKAVCWKDTTHIGYCSTQPDTGGACTCN